MLQSTDMSSTGCKKLKCQLKLYYLDYFEASVDGNVPSILLLQSFATGMKHNASVWKHVSNSYFAYLRLVVLLRPCSSDKKDRKDLESSIIKILKF